MRGSLKNNYRYMLQNPLAQIITAVKYFLKKIISGDEKINSPGNFF